ncbi:MAG: hypothetical protein GWM98_17990 [Nitrospinaceae bacterium]|nr:hypothetical protein [Nitrospinaceae bacterium]NIR56040.1 hypothetical protein [Nitrospinaceae bacterium]NIS86484.1 hypothetical protein [Nitrospinaceae bacterium]NIT83319.1 hypothetical protein [Nitrospinaceae bacterium]NIU45529.1 hypothetical protein [Nitrospinaceae bacterium]
MLAFAIDISRTGPSHPEEKNIPKLKEYMQYQRGIKHDKLVYHALDHAKTYLEKAINEAKGDEKQLKGYLAKAFPFSCRYADGDTLMLMLRKLINAHNAPNNWYRLNRFYYGVLYDVLDRFLLIYNRLIREAPEKAADMDITQNVEIDFDDWVRVFFHDLDFLLGQPLPYVHFTFRKRHQAIEDLVKKEMDSGKSREEAVKIAGKKYNIEEDAISIFLNKSAGQQDMELFFTSTENPIYEHFYDVESAEGLMDGESLVHHVYFLAHQLKGLTLSEAEAVVSEIEKLSKH